jgi:signal peptidase I
MSETGQGGVAAMDGSQKEAQLAAEKKNPQTVRKPFLGITNPILSELASIGILVAIVLAIRSSVFSIYVIPTGSMLPTIKIDDRVFANKLAYGLMLPFTETQLVSWAEPRRGEIVLFRSPVEDQTFVKRIVGVAGDRVSLTNGVLTVNGSVASETVQVDRTVMKDMGGELDPNAKDLYRQQLLDLPEHFVLRSRSGGVTFYESRTFVVPEGQLFLMGDNRDGSNDSRSWGFVRANQVYGRASFILYSTDRTAEGFLPKFRTNRFFRDLDRLDP